MAKKPSLYSGVHTLTLPSTKRVKVRRPSLLSLIASGAFPSELSSEAWRMTKEFGLGKRDLVESSDGLKKWLAVLDAVVPHVLVDPQVSETSSLEEDDETSLLSGTITLSDLRDLDKQFIFLYGTGIYLGDEEIEEKKRLGKKEDEAVGLMKFRDESEGSTVGLGSEAIQSEAVEFGGDPTRESPRS